MNTKTVDNTMLLTSSLDDLLITMSNVAHKKYEPLPDVLYWVESFGCVLLPPTSDRRDAEAVYHKSASNEKAILLQVGDHRSALLTNAPFHYPSTQFATKGNKHNEHV